MAVSEIKSRCLLYFFYDTCSLMYRCIDKLYNIIQDDIFVDVFHDVN